MKGEFDFIRDIKSLFPSPDGVCGIGDDCAVIPQRDGMETLVSTDMMMEGVHFLKDDIPAYALGWKSAAASFSDIAAMGGTPVGSFLALSVSASVPESWAAEFLRGYRDVSELCGFPLLGGDTTSSPDRICVCVTVLGKSASGLCRKRSDALPGDLVCVTGTLGDSAAGLEAILKGFARTDEVQRLIGRHYLPRPRISEGGILASCPGVHAMMDISDGLASDVRHIMEESGIGVSVDTGKLPLSDDLLSFCRSHGLDPLHFALSGGEDYELLFTVDPSALDGLEVPCTVIGVVTSGRTLLVDGKEASCTGFRHFE